LHLGRRPLYQSLNYFYSSGWKGVWSAAYKKKKGSKLIKKKKECGLHDEKKWMQMTNPLTSWLCPGSLDLISHSFNIFTLE
jgi:hypothetical protein